MKKQRQSFLSVMWTSRGNRECGILGDCEACLASSRTAYWNHKWLNVSQTALIQVETGEKLAGGLNIIEAFSARKLIWPFFHPPPTSPPASVFCASLLKGEGIQLMVNCVLLITHLLSHGCVSVCVCQCLRLPTIGSTWMSARWTKMRYTNLLEGNKRRVSRIQ